MPEPSERRPAGWHDPAHPAHRPGTGVPAKGYTWPPFEPGNVAALRHGAFYPRRYEPLAEELVTNLLALAAEPSSPVAYLTEEPYRPAVWAWARCEARIQLVTEYLLDKGGDLDPDGEVRPAARLLEVLEGRAEKLRARLGLDPLARARLGRDVTAARLDVAQLMAALARQEAVEGPQEPAGGNGDDETLGGTDG